MRTLANILKDADWNEKSQLNEGISYQYQPPEDIEQKIYDFYLFSLYHGYLMKPKQLRIRPGQNEETINDLKEIVDDGYKKSMAAVKKELIDATVVSLVVKIRHAAGRYGMGSERKEIEKALDVNLLKKFSSFASNYKDYWSLENKTGFFGKEALAQGEGAKKDWSAAKIAFDKSHTTVEELLQMCLKLFPLDIWHDTFRSDEWVKASKILLDLIHAKDDVHTLLAIDALIDIEHNSGSVFSKSAKMMQKGSNWTKKAFDLKSEGKPWDLAKKSSIPSRIIGPLNRLTGADGAFDQSVPSGKD